MTASSKTAGAPAPPDSDVGIDWSRLNRLPAKVAVSRALAPTLLQVGRAMRSEDEGGSTLGQHTDWSTELGEQLPTLPMTNRRALSWAIEVAARTGTVPPGPLVASTVTGIDVPVGVDGPAHPASAARSNNPTIPAPRTFISLLLTLSLRKDNGPHLRHGHQRSSYVVAPNVHNQMRS